MADVQQPHEVEDVRGGRLEVVLGRIKAFAHEPVVATPQLAADVRVHRGVVAALRARDAARIDELRTRQRRRSCVPALTDVDELAVVAGQRVAEVLAPADVDGRCDCRAGEAGRRAGDEQRHPGPVGLAPVLRHHEGAARRVRGLLLHILGTRRRRIRWLVTRRCRDTGRRRRMRRRLRAVTAARPPRDGRADRRDQDHHHHSADERPNIPPRRVAQGHDRHRVRFSRRLRRVAVNDRDRREGLGNALQAERADIAKAQPSPVPDQRPHDGIRERLARCRGSLESRRLDDRHARILAAVLRDLTGTDADAQLRRIVGVKRRDRVMHFARALDGVSDTPRNTTMSPSPALLTSWPPHVAIAARNADMKRTVKASNESSPSRARRCVEATRSQKRIVTVSVVAIGCIMACGPPQTLSSWAVRQARPVDRVQGTMGRGTRGCGPRSQLNDARYAPLLRSDRHGRPDRDLIARTSPNPGCFTSPVSRHLRAPREILP